MQTANGPWFRRMTVMHWLLALAAVVGAVALIIWFSTALMRPPAIAAPPPPIGSAIVVGYTEVTTGHHISQIDVYRDKPGVWPAYTIGYVAEGQRVAIYARDKATDSVLIKLPDGTPAYLATDFIRE